MADSNRDGQDKQDKKFQISNLELAFPVLILSILSILSIPVNFSFCKRSRAWECGPRGDAFRFGGGEDEAEARAAPRHALDLDVAAVLCENLPDVPMQSWIALAREPETPSTPGKACSL